MWENIIIWFDSTFIHSSVSKSCDIYMSPISINQKIKHDKLCSVQLQWGNFVAYFHWPIKLPQDLPCNSLFSKCGWNFQLKVNICGTILEWTASCCSKFDIYLYTELCKVISNYQGYTSFYGGRCVTPDKELVCHVHLTTVKIKHIPHVYLMYTSCIPHVYLSWWKSQHSS